MQPKMLYMRKTPLSGGAILFLLSAGFVLFPTQWLGDLLTQDELLAQMLGLGILRIVMAAIMLVLALQMGIRGVWAPAKLPYLLFALPALAVAVNNLPVVALCRGTAGVTGGGEYVAAFALQCLGVGLFEEVAFRGVIFPFALGVTGTGKKGRFAAVLLSSAAFGLLHLVNLLGGFSGGVFLQVGYSFLIGCMLSVCVFCGSGVFACALVHAVYNFCGNLIYSVGNFGFGAFKDVWCAEEIVLTALVSLAAIAYFALILWKKSPAQADLFAVVPPESDKKEEENADERADGADDR